MCGLAGYWMPHGDRPDATAMATALRHRGPDDAGVWTDADAGVGLSHRRLAIVDLSPAGHQPMASPSGRYMLVYNGEIYNHEELRAALEQEGAIAWRGHSDTETLIAGIERWGLEQTLQRAVGMFAIALWDRRDRTLSLARDRMGEKPLFYGWSDGGLVFGSELKALRTVAGLTNPVSADAVHLFFRFNYIPAPFSILAGIFKVEPGVIVTLDARALTAAPDRPPSVDDPGSLAGVDCRRYWSLAETVAAGPDATMTESEALSGLETRLSDAIRLQTMADVPVGAFLSGGVDSSLIVALMSAVAGAQVRSFTIGFDAQGFDEAPFARAVAKHLGTDHTEAYVSPEDVRAIIPELPRIYDEPFADSSQIPTVLLSRLTRRSVTVALSGDAGDELFGGYNRYLVSQRYWRAAARLPAPARTLLARTVRGIAPATWDRMGRFARVPMLGVKVHKVGRILQTPCDTRAVYRAAAEEWEGSPPVRFEQTTTAPVDRAVAFGDSDAERMMYWDSISYLPDDILAKVDRAAMCASLETRVPFLDHRVVEQAWRTPMRFKVREGRGKWLLRALLDRHVPRALIERPKAGFAIPIGAWLAGPLRDWAEDLLSADALAVSGMLDTAAIRAQWAEHLAGSFDRTASLWSVLMFQAWFRTWQTDAAPVTQAWSAAA